MLNVSCTMQYSEFNSFNKPLHLGEKTNLVGHMKTIVSLSLAFYMLMLETKVRLLRNLM